MYFGRVRYYKTLDHFDLFSSNRNFLTTSDRISLYMIFNTASLYFLEPIGESRISVGATDPAPWFRL